MTITDPLNRVSRVEYFQGSSTCTPTTTPPASKIDSNGISCSEQVVPLNMTTDNTLLQFRNTFIWDPVQYTKCSASTCYQYAKIIHWLHTNQAPGSSDATAARVPESVKEPLESRVWFDYENQSSKVSGVSGGSSGAIVVGSTNQPTAIGRNGNDGTASQLFQYQYNAYGKVTQFTDPAGRQLTMTYDTNGIDLLTVTNTTDGNPAHHDLLLTLADYNTQHEPQRVVQANGQVTSLSYNAAGQLTTSTDPLLHTWQYSYAPTNGGYLDQITGPAGPQVPQYTVSYDKFGQPATSTDPAGEALTYSYDAANRLTKVLFPDQTSVLLGYTLLDLTSFTDRRANQTIHHYDADRELYEIDEPAGRTTVLSYLPNGALQTIQDSLKFVTAIGTDIERRITGISYPDNTQKSYVYDLEGRLLSVSPSSNTLDPATIVYSYNPDDTVSEIAPKTGPPVPIFFQYDPAYGWLTSWSLSPTSNCPLNFCPTTSETFSYNPVASPPALGANRISKEATVVADTTHPANAASTAASTYTYDALDRVITHTLSSPQMPAQTEQW